MKTDLLRAVILKPLEPERSFLLHQKTNDVVFRFNTLAAPMTSLHHVTLVA